MNKQNTDHDRNVILYQHPSGVAARKARRGYPMASFNDRSPQTRAIKAHLRASAYDRGRESEPVLSLARGGSIPAHNIPPWLHLRRSYGEEARRNFVRDGILLAVMVAISTWALIHAVQAMAGP